VRYWYPGLAGQGNFHNFVMTDRAGSTNYLAMPYSNGLTVSLVNRGKKRTGDLGLAVSYEPATDATRADITSRMRLHAVLQPAADTDRLVDQAGAGRMVGLVFQPAAAPMRLTLACDGKPVGAPGGCSVAMLLGVDQPDFRTCLSGRHGSLAWRYFWLAPVEFGSSLVATADSTKQGDRLAIFYLKR
jgi:hypothetical protein